MGLLTTFLGALVGLSLGLTGGGGAIFAVPLLVYGLGVAPREAVASSLAAVGVTALAGFFLRWRQGQVELRTGLLFALAGMMGAPLGTWLAHQLSEPTTLTLFGLFMLVVARQMWVKANTPVVDLQSFSPQEHAEVTCQRDAAGTLILTSRCALMLLLVGVLSGVLSGLFGIGGGFIIVPALMVFSSMPMPRAIGTSLMIITLVSVVSLVSQWGSGQQVPWNITGLFAAGSIGGMFAGQQLGRSIPPRHLQRVFAVMIVAVAVFVLIRNR